MKKLIPLLLIIAAITLSCKKYKDGPLISFRTVKHRLLGNYNLTQYTVNGADSLSLLNDSLPLGLSLAYDDVNDYYVGNIGGWRSDGKGAGIGFQWELSDDNTKIIIEYCGGSPGTGPIGNGKNLTWTILKLSNKETRWEITYNGKEYFIDLKKS